MGYNEWSNRKRMKIGLMVNKDCEGKFVTVEDARFEIGMGGGSIASTVTTKEPALSNHHSNFILEVNEMEKIQIKQATEKGFIEMEFGGVADLSFPASSTRRGRVQEGGTVCPTLTAANQELCRIEKNYRIRKLTPLECFRLMGVQDEDSKKMLTVNSNSQCYKQAGNSIVVDVMSAMFKKLF